MSELKVNKLSPASGTAFTLGDSGDTFTIPSGATIVNSGTATNFGSASVCVQVKYTVNQTYSTATGIPFALDDSIPQISEGNTCNVDTTITPTSASNILVIQGQMNGASSVSGDINYALFQDTTANALWAGKVESSNATPNHFDAFPLTYVMLAGTTSATTFKVHFGPPSGTGTMYINGGQSSGRKYGGVSACVLTVTEYTP